MQDRLDCEGFRIFFPELWQPLRNTCAHADPMMGSLEDFSLSKDMCIPPVMEKGHVIGL